MFDKFNDSTRAAVLISKDMASDFDQNHINTGHLLLAITGAVAGTPTATTSSSAAPSNTRTSG